MEAIAAEFFEVLRAKIRAEFRGAELAQQLIAAAKADGADKGRRCIVVGEHAVYIDPPEFSGTDWSVSWGPKPLTTG